MWPYHSSRLVFLLSLVVLLKRRYLLRSSFQKFWSLGTQQDSPEVRFHCLKPSEVYRPLYKAIGESDTFKESWVNHLFGFVGYFAVQRHSVQLYGTANFWTWRASVTLHSHIIKSTVLFLIMFDWHDQKMAEIMKILHANNKIKIFTWPIH